MAESRHWQISAALISALEAIEGDNGATYWYEPSRVVREAFSERLMADASLTHILALRAQEESHSEQSTGSSATGGVVGAVAEFTLLMLRRDERATDPFDEASPTRGQIVDRMVRDVLRAIWSDVTLGGLASNIVAGSLVIDRDVAVEGPWAVAEMRFSVEYDYLALTP